MQFNWIFVLVAGTAILLFFTVVVVKQKNVSEMSTKATVLKSIEAIIIGASVGTDTTNIIDIPDSDIEVNCGRVSLGSISKQYQSLILFAPSSLKGDKLVTQTLAFSAPYRATNLLYITSPQLRYIIIGNNNIAREINKSMPSGIKKEFYTLKPQVKNLNDYKVKFVIVGEMTDFPISLKNMQDPDVTAIRVDGDEKKGKVEFFQKDGDSWEPKGSSSYIGKASLMGAVHADTLESYECSMRNSFFRLNLITKIYEERAKKLTQAVSGIQCKQLYSSALNHLIKIREASSNFNEGNIDKISAAADSLASENKNMQVYSCPLVY